MNGGIRLIPRKLAALAVLLPFPTLLRGQVLNGIKNPATLQKASA